MAVKPFFNLRNIFQKRVSQRLTEAPCRSRKCFLVNKPILTGINYSFSTVKNETQESLRGLRAKLVKDMGVPAGYNPVPHDRTGLIKYLPKSQDELPKRSMGDSFMVGYIPLSKEKALQDRYVSYLGHIRVGRLLEDMDIFAVMVAHKHIVNPNLPPGVPFPHTLVTALVDRIEFEPYWTRPEEDIKLSGHVSYAGLSSMEVVVWVEQMADGKWNRITRALFLMVARDSVNKKAAIINAIEPANEREKKIISGGAARKQKRMDEGKKDLLKVIPDAEEQKIIHDIYIRTTNISGNIFGTKTLPINCKWMSDSKLSNIVFSHPEDRNLHNTVFGGFIMRQAGELSWTLACIFSKQRPRLKSISDINFRKPVMVNALLQMHAQVVFTQDKLIQVLLFAEISDPVTGLVDITNSFNFTYEAPKGNLPEVVPLSYHEAMLYVDGRRHYHDVLVAKKIVSGDW